jgi:hypothetical protein
MKTSTTVIITSVAVLIAIGAFYNGSLNTHTNTGYQYASALQDPEAEEQDTTDPTISTGWFTFSSGKEFIKKGSYIGSGLMGTKSQTDFIVPVDAGESAALKLGTLVVRLDKPVGKDQFATFKVLLNDKDTLLGCTITGATQTHCEDTHTGDEFEVHQFDVVNLKVTDLTKKAKSPTASATLTIDTIGV